MNSEAGRRAQIASTCCAVAGGLGAIACSVSMILATVGLVGTAAAASGSVAGMAGMGSTRSQTAPSGLFGNVLSFLVRGGPLMLIVSVLAIAVSLGIRRRAAVIPAVVAGAVMYAGMYLQSNVPVMYAAIALGLIVWASVYLWTRQPPSRLRG
jgi:hypothetical protein